MPAIDAHVHVWTDDRKRYPRSIDRTAQPDRFTASDFWAHAKPAGVTRAVLIQMSFYRFDNAYMLDTMREHKGVFSGVAIVDSLSASPDDSMKNLASSGVRGFRITPGASPGRWLETSG